LLRIQLIFLEGEAMGFRLLKKYIHDFDLIEVNNSRNILPIFDYISNRLAKNITGPLFVERTLTLRRSLKIHGLRLRASREPLILLRS
jgi:hypothetical protein